MWIRLVAVLVIVAAVCLPRSERGAGQDSARRSAERTAEVAHK